MLAKAQQQVNEAAGKYIDPFATGTTGAGYDYWNIMGGLPVQSISDLARYSIDFGQQYGTQLNQYNMGQLQGLLNQAMPGYQDMMQQMRVNTEQLQRGVIPQDVQTQIRNNAAFTSLQGGFAGAGGGMTGAITARDLGLTSLQLQQQGAAQGSNLMQLARNYLMPQPVNPMSLLPTSDLIQGAQWTKTANYNANLAAFNAAEQAAALSIGVPNQSQAGGLGALGGIGQGLQGLAGPIGDLFSNFGGGGGGGGGGIIDTSGLSQGTVFGY